MSDSETVMSTFDEYIDACVVNIADDACEDKDYWYTASCVLREIRDVIKERLYKQPDNA